MFEVEQRSVDSSVELSQTPQESGAVRPDVSKEAAGDIREESNEVAGPRSPGNNRDPAALQCREWSRERVRSQACREMFHGMVLKVEDFLALHRAGYFQDVLPA
jgi:hypothetical protein